MGGCWKSPERYGFWAQPAGADIHEIDNSASRCGRLLDEVAGDADAVERRREEIITAMAATAKPYFGDVADMTYRNGCSAMSNWRSGPTSWNLPIRRGWTSPGGIASPPCCSAPRPDWTPATAAGSRHFSTPTQSRAKGCLTTRPRRSRDCSTAILTPGRFCCTRRRPVLRRTVQDPR